MLAAVPASTASAQTGSTQVTFDEGLIKGERVSVHETPRRDVKVSVPANATPEELMVKAAQRVDEANARYVDDLALSDSLRREAAALYRHARVRFAKQKRPDQALFAEAQALRQDGDFEAMAKTITSLMTKHPRSAVASTAALALGDYYFDVSELDKARAAYERVLEGPPSFDTDYARYKLAWIAVNNADCDEALRRFGEVLHSRVPRPSPPNRDIREEALVDMVYCYAKNHSANQAISEVTSAPVSKTAQLRALAALGRRYDILDRTADALRLYQKLRGWSTDPSKRREIDDQVRQLKARLPSKGTTTP